ncbi:MAG TPA: MlaD family protein [Planctomycetota bacterium]|nr:MlaD family protein [Planctomycetota bacterium]
MARKKRSEALVGLFTFAGLALFLSLIFVMGGLDRILEERTTVAIEFADVQGLEIGDPVYLFGLKAGFVRDIEVARAEEGSASPRPARLRVTADLPARYRNLIRETSRVRIDKSITGSLSVLIQESADGAGAVLAADQTLAGEPTPALGDITADLDLVLDEGREIAAEILEIVKSVRRDGDLVATLGNLEELTSTLRERAEPLLRELGQTTEALRETTETLRDLLRDNSEPLSRTVARLDTSTEIVERLLASLETVPANLEEGLASLEKAGSTVTRLLDENRAGIRSVVEDLTETMASASNLAAEVKRRPWRLLYKPDLAEQKALELYDAAWAYNLGATELHRSVRLLAHHLERAAAEGAGGGESAEEGGSAQGESLREAIARVEESLARQREAEEAFWARLSAAK